MDAVVTAAKIINPASHLIIAKKATALLERVSNGQSGAASATNISALLPETLAPKRVRSAVSVRSAILDA
jgi:hypothetical protein